ncbi:MAG TPA: hypothetical protein VFF68_12055 [Anaerolineaceae bacterium]|nr:hypothetical protein [Anaerolineaceae bacterium]
MFTPMIFAEVHPYLDPGSGSLILQMLLAGLLGAGVVIRLFWKKIKALFGKGEAEQVESEDE